ncbi:MAG: DUF2283 domain-containing protein [Candidatus Zambryskibacteria bacterium]|nr:DUF2283 domain-containing protein [Candidatus Zambryskibacteria bacterium]
MKVTYDKKIDSKYVKIGAVRKSVKTKKLEDWLLVDYDVKGNIIGVEILWASKHPILFSISKKKFFSYFQIPKNSVVENRQRSKNIFLNMPLEVSGV